MTLNPSEVVITIINFLILLLVLNKLLFKPYLKFMDERQAAVNSAEKAALAAKEQLSETQDELRLKRVAVQAEYDEQSIKARSELLDAERAQMREISATLETLRVSGEEELRERERELLDSMETVVPEMSERLLANLLKGGA